jgi:hypothetical protein
VTLHASALRHARAQEATATEDQQQHAAEQVCLPLNTESSTCVVKQGRC